MRPTLLLVQNSNYLVQFFIKMFFETKQFSNVLSIVCSMLMKLCRNFTDGFKKWITIWIFVELDAKFCVSNCSLKFPKLDRLLVVSINTLVFHVSNLLFLLMSSQLIDLSVRAYRIPKFVYFTRNKPPIKSKVDLRRLCSTAEMSSRREILQQLKSKLKCSK